MRCRDRSCGGLLGPWRRGFEAAEQANHRYAVVAGLLGRVGCFAVTTDDVNELPSACAAASARMRRFQPADGQMNWLLIVSEDLREHIASAISSTVVQ